MSEQSLPHLFRYENGPWADPVLFAPWLFERREERLHSSKRKTSTGTIDAERRKFALEAIHACKAAANGKKHDYPTKYARFAIKPQTLIERFRAVAREWLVFPASFSLQTFSYSEYPDGYIASQMLFLGALHRRDDLWMRDALEVARRALTYLPQSMRSASDSEQGIIQYLSERYGWMPKPYFNAKSEAALRECLTESKYASRFLISRAEEAHELHLTTDTHVGDQDGLKVSPVLFEVDPTGTISEARIAQSARIFKLTVNQERKTARLNGKTYSISEKQCELLLGLLESYPDWISLTSLAQGNERMDRHRKNLPKPIRNLVESIPGKGTRLRTK